MGCFDDVVIGYDGAEYTVPAGRVMGLIEAIEAHITLDQLLGGEGMQRAKMAKAYAAAIKYAGGKVTQEEVYQSFFSDGLPAVQEAIMALLAMMIPPEQLRDKMPVGDADTKKKGAQ